MGLGSQSGLRARARSAIFNRGRDLAASPPAVCARYLRLRHECMHPRRTRARADSTLT